MSEKVKRICGELEVSREEAMFYLEGFDEKLDVAMEACRNKTLPPVKAKPWHRVPVKEESAVLEEPSKPPLPIKPLRIVFPTSNQPEQQPPQSKDQLIHTFCQVALGATPQDAVACLEREKWNVDNAVSLFMVIHRPTQEEAKSQRRSGFDLSTIGNQKLPPGRYPMGSNLPSFPQGFSGDESSVAVATELMQGMSPIPVTELRLPSQSQSQASLDSIGRYFSSLDNSSKEAGGEHIPNAIPSQVPDPTALICDENDVPREVALYYLEATNWDLEAATQASRSETLPPEMEVSESTATVPPMVINSRRVTNQRLNSPEQHPPQFSPEKILLFQEITNGRASTEEAISCLKVCDGNVELAVNFYYEKGSLIAYRPEEHHSTVVKSSPVQHLEDDYYSDEFSEEATSNSDKEADADKNVTVTVPAPALSQVDKANAVNEDSSAQVITLKIQLVSGEMVQIPFRLDQTVRDIRKAIAELRPDDTREYYLSCEDGFDCTKLDTTVERIKKFGSTNLIQILSD